MKRSALVLGCVAILGATAYAQEKPAPPPMVPLELEVVISRYDGPKRLSNLPYTLAVNTDNVPVQLNMGTQVPVPTNTFPVSGDSKPAPIISYNYRDVGTKIQASAYRVEDGRFGVVLSIDDGAVYTNPQTMPGLGPMPVFRTFNSRNTLLLRDGQTREYTAATDRVSGEVVKVSVTVRVVK